MQPHRTIHTHRLVKLADELKSRRNRKTKTEGGREDVGNRSAVASACTEQRGWVQPKRPRQLTSGTVLMAVVLTL